MMSFIHPLARIGTGVTFGRFAEVGEHAVIGDDCVVHGCVEGVIGPSTRVWRYAHVMAGAEVGSDTMIGQGVFVADTAIVGQRCKIENHTNISRGVVIGDEVYVGAGVQFCNSSHPTAYAEDTLYKITVGDRASIGSNVCLIGEIEIGEGAVIGAGAVVLQSVPSRVVAVGVPAHVVQPPEWDESGVCM
jgi:UDP-2-acetamido-3-amino-2,3-dideoxy-glucuronate N-acetyltransferase